MVIPSPRELLSTIEDAILSSTSTPSPSQRLQFFHTLRSAVPAFKSFLSYPVPKAADRAQVQSKEVRLPDSSPILLDDTDVEIALKLSDDLNINEFESVRLLVAANREFVLLGREPLEIYRLAAGLWYMERRDLITSLYTLLRAVVLDQNLDADIIAEIQKHLEDLLRSGLRERLVRLIKELNHQEPAGYGGPTSERYVIDFKGAIVERRSVVSRERLTLCHCLVFSVLVTRMDLKEVKDIFAIVKDCASELDSDAIVQLQIMYGLVFSLVISFVSDALRTGVDRASISSQDALFRHEFSELVMATSGNPNVEGYVDVIRLAWAVHMMITQDRSTSREIVAGTSSKDLRDTLSCLDHVCAQNVFKFLLTRIILTAAYQNEDEDVMYMYNGYLHKLMMYFVSHPISRDKVKEMKEKAMSILSPYVLAGSDAFSEDALSNTQLALSSQAYVSLLELVSEIYQREPEFLYGNEELWSFAHVAGEDHTNIHTLVAFLRLLSTLASTEEGATRVFELLQGKMFRSVGWSTLFDSLSIYEEKFKQSLQTPGTLLPELPQGDAQALVAYLHVLQKVIENGNATQRKGWFPDIEPLFKLLGYENVPPYLKGALRNAIAAFIKVSPTMKDTIWNYLEQYDLPVIIGRSVGTSEQQISSQVYDMRFELDEVEARSERYPSTVSFLNLLNTLIAEEKDTSDKGRRFVGIFRFVCDHVFGPFPQRAYADPMEKWQLVVSCLQHFKMILQMYSINDEDIGNVVDMSQPLAMAQSSSLETQLPVVELMKDFMSGKTIFRNIMSIISLGVSNVITERASQTYGQLLEKSVNLSLEIIILVMERDLYLADFWRPLYQPLDIILSQDHNLIVGLLEYVRYYLLPQIQQCSIKIMSILSSRIFGLVQLLIKSNSAKYLIEDYATCLESRFDEPQTSDNKDDTGILILQLLVDNLSRPAPSVTHLLLSFDLDSPVEQTTLQPKVHYSCLKVILDNLEILSRPDVNFLLHECSFQLLYDLCLDPLTSGPTVDLLSTKRYQFFSKHLGTVSVAPLPKRSTNQAFRISSLHQRAWLLKLLALELHLADMSLSTQKETCLAILSLLFPHHVGVSYRSPDSSRALLDGDATNAGRKTLNRSNVLELLEIIQFRLPYSATQRPQLVSVLKLDMQVDDILRSSATSDMGGVYFFSDRGDRLIDLDAFHDRIWKFATQFSSHINDAEKIELRASIQQLLRWAWGYNKNLEENAAQLHMLTGWSQIVEICISRRMSLLEDHSQILFELLGASLSASASPDCSVKMALALSNVALTCMAKLRDERFMCSTGLDSDSVTSLDIVSLKQLPNGACQSILLKLVMALLRSDSSESLRRRQYALLLSYFQYSRAFCDPEIPASVLRFLFRDEQDEDDVLNLQKIDKEQAELTRANFLIIRKEGQAIIDLVMRDALKGSEVGKAVSYYILDAFLSIDQEKYFLNQLQRRGILRSCLIEISNFSSKDGGYSLESLQRICTLEAQLSLLLRVGHSYGKHGAQILFSMGSLEHLGISKAVGLTKRNARWAGHSTGRNQGAEFDKQRMLVTPVLKLVSLLTSLVESSDFLEVKNKIVREVVEFVKCHQSIFDNILREDVFGTDESNLEQLNLVVSILSKVWQYEENDEYGFVQGLFGMMCTVFGLEGVSSTFNRQSDTTEKQKTLEFAIFRLCFSLSSYLYALLVKKQLRLPVSDHGELRSAGMQQQPSLNLLLSLLSSVTVALERAGEEKFMLLNKIQDINELSRQEVDEIINLCMRQDCILSSDNIRKRRHVAMTEMCRMAGKRDQLITLLLKLAERILNILVIHLQEEKTDSEEISSFCGRLHQTLEMLDLLREDKIGHGLKMFRRSVSLAKEICIKNMSM